VNVYLNIATATVLAISKGTKHLRIRQRIQLKEYMRYASW